MMNQYKERQMLSYALLVVIMLFSIFSFSKNNAFAADKKQIVLRYSEISPPKGTRSDAVKRWCSDVEKRTDGKIKFEMYWSQSLLKGKENIHGVGQGVADLGYCAPQYNPSDLPLWTFISPFPFAKTSLDNVYKAEWALYDQEQALHEELKKKNLKLISIFPYDFYTLWTRKVRIQTLGDLKGLKLRVSSKGHAEALKAVGCASVFMPAGDIYSALQKGTVGGMIFPLEHTYSYGLYEVVKYGIDVHILGITGLLAMNLNTWKKLPADVQKIFIDTGRQLTFDILSAIALNRAETAKKVQASGVEMYDLPKKELEKWADLPEVKNMMSEWVKDKESKGLPGERIMNKFIQLMK